VLENRSRLVFPFRRYQIQKCWRGERPALGRFKEFLQADFDIIDESDIPVSYDLEMIETANELLASLPIPETHLLVSNRKIQEGFCQASGISDIHSSLHIMDKLDKIGEEEVFRRLTESIGISASAAQGCIQLCRIKGQDPDRVAASIRSLGARHPLLEEGLSELCAILQACRKQPGNQVWADLSVVRGLDYYTGTVCEGKFVQFPAYPSILGGGRYDNLASKGDARLPGVGLSIGITRILGLILHGGFLQSSRKTPSCVLVALVSDDARERSVEIAQTLRKRGIACEVFPRALKYGRQIAYAGKQGIPYVWFPVESGEGWGEVKDIRTGSQAAANPMEWTPPDEDIEVQVIEHEERLHNLSGN
jgi:histidyl-tRNA synthetase